MAYETELGNIKTVDAVLSDLASPALVENSQVLDHVVIQPATNKTVRFVIDGNLVGEVVAESTAYTPSANSEIVQSGVDCTVQKYVNIYYPTVEQMAYGMNTPGVHNNIAAEQGRALSVALNATWLSLFDDFTTSGNVSPALSGVMTLAALNDAVYAVESNLLGATSGEFHAVLDRKAVHELRKELSASEASVFTLPSEIALFTRTGQVKSKNYRGSIGAIKVYETSGLPVAAGVADVGLVFDPKLAFGLAVDPRGIQTASNMVLTAGMKAEIASWLFANVTIIRDKAGCMIASAT